MVFCIACPFHAAVAGLAELQRVEPFLIFVNRETKCHPQLCGLASDTVRGLSSTVLSTNTTVLQELQIVELEAFSSHCLQSVFAYHTQFFAFSRVLRLTSIEHATIVVLKCLFYKCPSLLNKIRSGVVLWFLEIFILLL